MLTVQRPPFDAKTTYMRCTTSVRDADLRSRLEAVAPHVAHAARAYSSHAAVGELHRIPQTHGVADVVSNQELVDVYDLRMSRQSSPGRDIYDALRLLPENGVCPFCAQRNVSTLDHVLPKSLFSALAVVPDNLVGACRDCNHAKSSNAPSRADDSPIHPYFDDISGEQWLHATVVEHDVAVVKFHVNLVSNWTDQLNSRVRRQFEKLNLASLYSFQAAQELTGQRANIARIFDARGAAGVREEMVHQQRSWENVRLNSWQAATFHALSRSTWYCSGGFGRE